jgi:hypothetical protein
LISANLFGTHWRPIFIINVPIAAAVAIAGLKVLPSIPLLAGFVILEHRAAARGRQPVLNLRMFTSPAISWGLAEYALVTSTYFALLFVIALYLQQGLGFSPLASGLTLVSWVVAFGIPGRLMNKAPDALGPAIPWAGCLILAAGYGLIAAVLFTGAHPEALLIILLGIGGFGLGANFTAILAHLTKAAGKRYAADISGVFTTSGQVAGTIGVAAFGTAYLAQLTHPSSGQATHVFATISAAFAAAALIAAAIADRSTHTTVAAKQGLNLCATRRPYVVAEGRSRDTFSRPSSETLQDQQLGCSANRCRRWLARCRPTTASNKPLEVPSSRILLCPGCAYQQGEERGVSGSRLRSRSRRSGLSAS